MGTYLIFVIFFTLAKFLENKIYTEKLAFFGVIFIFQKFCQCKKNDKYEVCQCMNRFSGIYWSNDQTMSGLRLKCVSKYRSMQNIFEVNFAGAQAYYTLHCNYNFNWSCILIWLLNQISCSFSFFNFPSSALNCLKMFTVCFLARHCSAGIFCCNKRYR